MDDYGESIYDDNEDDKNEFKVHEGIILAIHLSPSMYNKMSSIFSTFLNLLKHLIKTMPNTGLGLYIGNCNKKDDDKNSSIDTPEGIYRIFRLQDMNQGMLKTLDRYIKNSISKDSFIDISFNKGENWDKLLPIKDQNIDESFGHLFYSMLQQSLIDFNHIPLRTEEYTSRKIFFFTDCHKPFNGDEIIKQKIHSKLRDLNSSKITVYPFIMSNTDDSDGYGDEVKKEEQEGAETNKNIDQLDEFKQLFDFPLDLESKKYLPAINEISLNSLEEKIMKHSTVRRLVFQCPLIFDKLKISVKGINPFTSVELKKVKFYNANNRLRYVNRKNTHISNEKEIDNNEITKVYQIADQYLSVDKQIQTECLQFGEPEKPILHILGTRKFKYFNPSYTISKSVFMIADDDGEHEDSLDKFAALYKSLFQKKMMVLCWGMPRKLSYPRFYYLIPTALAENYGLSSFERYPQSLAMIEFPFGNEIRKAPDYIDQLDSLKEIDDSHLLDKIINFSISDKFKTYPNPKLAWNFQIMEDHILQVEIPESERVDGLNLSERQLKLDGMYQHMLTLRKKIDNNSDLTLIINDLRSRYNRIANFNELKRTADEKFKSSKRVHAQQSDELLTDTKIVIFYHEFGLKNCTNDMLRSYIKSKGGIIKIGKNKGEMIANIVEYLQNNSLL
jgi:ATP-dependent DNA helicase 2 subunit 1